MTEIEYIKHMGILPIQPGDVVVVKVDHMLCDMAYKSLTDRLKGIFPNSKCIVLEAGADIGVMRDGESKREIK